MEHNYEMKQYVARDLLLMELIKILDNNNNIDEIEKILNSPIFSVLPKSELEHYTFRAAYFNLGKNPNNDILKYLIFDYKIKKEVSIDLIEGDIIPLVQQMFESRILKSELSQELDTTNLKNNKTPKV